MLCGIPGKNPNVIQVKQNESVQEVMKNIIYQVLEHSRCISLSERHYMVFKVAELDVECSLSLVPFLYMHQVVSVLEVQLRKDRSLLQGFKGGVD